MTSELKSAPHEPPACPPPVSEANGACPYCGGKPFRPRPLVNPPPFVVLMSLGRLVIAIAAAILLIGVVSSAWRHRADLLGGHEHWGYLAAFVIVIGVLWLFELRDFLYCGRLAPPSEDAVATSIRIVMPSPRHFAAVWESIGTMVLIAWLPHQSEDDRLAIGRLTAAEHRELLARLATAALSVAGTTAVPILLAFLLPSPITLCIAATAMAANLFLLDWLKKRHKKWLDAAGYARPR